MLEDSHHETLSLPSEYTVKPYTPVSRPDTESTGALFPIGMVAPVVGMAESFVRKVLGRKPFPTEDDVRVLLDQDAFAETFVPRSKVLGFLRKEILQVDQKPEVAFHFPEHLNSLTQGDAVDLIQALPDESIDCVVTSTPYWAMRVYDTIIERTWADGETCSFGLEQTPEGFIRHTVEILYRLLPKVQEKGSVFWNLLDTYNTRTQIRSNAAEALHAMQGKDRRSWSDHQYRRYSSGHSYLFDGEQALIPQRIAERASRIGYFNKSTISWCKTATTPEPQLSRVSRNVEYVLHLTKHRTPKFFKESYLQLPPMLGGKQPLESEKLSDFWYLPTSAGRDGHGAQFPLQLPGRCIAIATEESDVVLDPFIGSGTTALAAAKLNRHYIGFDISPEYLTAAHRKVDSMNDSLF